MNPNDRTTTDEPDGNKADGSETGDFIEAYIVSRGDGSEILLQNRAEMDQWVCGPAVPLEGMR